MIQDTTERRVWLKSQVEGKDAYDRVLTFNRHLVNGEVTVNDIRTCEGMDEIPQGNEPLTYFSTL